jgi:hypothetical protein
MPAGGRQQAAEHAEGGGLARAVGAEQTEDLAPRHLEGGAGDSGEVAKLAYQIAHHDHRPVPIAIRGHLRGRRGRSGRRCRYPGRRLRALGMLLAQHHHESVFEFFRARLVVDVAEQSVQHVGFHLGLADEPHRAAFGHRIDDQSIGVDQSCLQVAGGHTGRWRGHIGHPSGAFAQRARSTFGEQQAFVHHEHLGAALGLVHVGGADDHAQPFVIDQLLHDLPQIAARQRIDAHAGLVQQQQVRRAHQRAGQTQLLLHAARELAGRTCGEARHVGHFQHAREALAAHCLRHAVQIGVEVQIFLHAQVFVQAEALRHVADAVLHRLRVVGDVDAQHAQCPRIGLEQSGHHAHQGGLAGTVRADQGRQLTRPHRQRQAAHRMQGTAARRLEGLAQPIGDDRRAAIAHCAVPAVRWTVAGCPRRSTSCGSSTSTRSS